MITAMRLPTPRGPLSAALCADLTAGPTLSQTTLATAETLAAGAADPLTDDDLQLSLAIAYELHYRGFDDVADDWEWDPELLRLRAVLEAAAPGRAARPGRPARRSPAEPVDQQLAALIAADDGPSLSAVPGQAGHARAVA